MGKRSRIKKSFRKENPSLYEINTAAWLYELSLQYGMPLTIGDVPAHEWDKIAAMGFHYIWLMGVWKRSRIGKAIFMETPEYRQLHDDPERIWTDEDVIGSPYSIAAYEPDPLIGDWKNIASVRDLLHNRGIGLILDFVPNHTAPDHPWVMEHPDYYIHGTEENFRSDPEAFYPVSIRDKVLYIARGRDPHFSNWPDTAQLNHFNPEMRNALIRALKKIESYCDGLRCDMAMLVLNDIFSRTWGWASSNSFHKALKNEFWKEVRDAFPGFLLMAEAYWDKEWPLQQLGFDYAYDKRLYDRVVSSSVHDINLHLKADISFQRKLTRFIENHDEPRSAGIFGKAELFAAAILFSTLPGMKLYHQGQLDGKKIKLPVQLRIIKAEEPDEAIRDFYGKLLSIISNDVFHEGEWQLKDIIPYIDDSFQNLIAYAWKSAGQVRLVVINLNQNLSQGKILLLNELKVKGDYLFIDELNNQKYIRRGDDMATSGLHVVLDGYKAHIFNIISIQ